MTCVIRKYDTKQRLNMVKNRACDMQKIRHEVEDKYARKCDMQQIREDKYGRKYDM